tara:strand:+ start:213 stop:551 length:339 start_codon:yes stop_codon:yes gene_type:complete
MTTRIHFRLAEDTNNEHSLWSGAFTVEKNVTRSQSRRLVAKHLRLEKLPPRTLVLTCRDLANGQWTAEEIRAETSLLADAPTTKARKKKKAFEDVEMSFDQAEDLLKKFGLK